MYIFFLFDLPAIICDVIYELEQKCVVNHIRKWIRFNRQSNQLSPIKSPITEHDGVLPVKKGIWIVTNRKCENSMIKYLPARGFWVDKLSIHKIRFLLVISVLWKSYLFFQKNKSYDAHGACLHWEKLFGRRKKGRHFEYGFTYFSI